MELTVALLLTSVLIKCALCALGDPNLYQYEAGPFIQDNNLISFPASNQLLYQLTPNVPQQLPEQRTARQLHHLEPSPPKVPTDTSQISKNLNSEINEVIEALNQLTENREDHSETRAAERQDSYAYPYGRPGGPSYGYSGVPSYGYSERPQSYGPWSPQHYSSNPPQYGHSSSSKLSLLKPDLLVKPIATKAASKVSGLVEIGLALLSGSAPQDLELKGFKDIVINGIVKPLLVAKGGLKSLISKLSIPLISLLLINLEVLITIWWLWDEECPAPVYHPPTYGHHPTKPAYQVPSYPPNYNYNPVNSYN